MTRFQCLLALVAFSLLPRSGLAGAQFLGLGDLPGGATASRALGVSGDGTVVVGESYSTNDTDREAFRWRADIGMVGMGCFSTVTQCDSLATDASTDGSVISGGCYTATNPGSGFAFRWTEAEGMVGLGAFNFPGGDTTELARRMSGDGNLIVGDLILDSFYDFQWTPENGVQPTSAFIFAEILENLAVSADGSAVAGWIFNDGLDALGDYAAHLNYQLVPVTPYLPPVYYLRAEIAGLNADGSVLVGQSILYESYERTTAFRWEDSVQQDLGSLGGAQSRAVDVSANGALVVGWSDTATGREAFLWDAVVGMRSLASELTTVYGLDLTGWTLEEATAISDDGSVIVGFGTNPSGDTEGFRVERDLTDCYNGFDDDGDGTIDGDDYGCSGPEDDSERTPYIDCDDGLDNDGDGFTDYPADPGCKNELWGIENPVCQNGLDDDGDGGIDFDGGAAANGGVPLADPDLQCNVPWKTKETSGGRNCGLGGEIALLLVLLPPLRRVRAAVTRARSGARGSASS